MRPGSPPVKDHAPLGRTSTRDTHGDEGADERRVVLFQHVVVGTFEADVELELGVLLHRRQSPAYVAEAPVQFTTQFPV